MRGRGAASYSFRAPTPTLAVVAIAVIAVIDVVGDVSLFKSNIGDSSAALWLAAWLLGCSADGFGEAAGRATAETPAAFHIIYVCLLVCAVADLFLLLYLQCKSF